jgi:hypothetical protein
MNRWTVLLAVFSLLIFAAMGCSGGDGSPVTPTADQGLTEAVPHTGQVQTHLWGYYDVMIDIENQTVEAVPSRSSMFAANVVQFLNNNPAGLSFNIISTPVGADYIDVSLDVAISHPLPGMPEYDGYDVRGVFIGDGSFNLGYGNGLRAAQLGTDQWHFNTDGYTRWFNPGEFPIPGLMGYTPGNFASAGFSGNGTVNSYKYYANGLGATSSYWTFLNATAGQGVFASGATNTRRYELRFPNAKGVTYGYSVVASWISETEHPGNAVEAVGCDMSIEPGVYYVDASDNGGDIIVEFDVFCWGDQPDAIFIDSPLLNNEYEMTGSEMIPIGGSGHVSTYAVEVPVDSVPSQDPSFFFIIPEFSDEDYTSEFTPPGGAPNAALAAFFRGEIEVLAEPPCPTPDPLNCDFDPPNGLSQPEPGAYTGVEITGTGFEGPTCIVEFIGPSMTYVATSVVTNGTDTITCDIDLTGADLGWYDVQVENGCGKTGTGDDLIELVCPTQVYYTTFDSTDPDEPEWAYVSTGYWGCTWFTGHINSRNIACSEFGYYWYQHWAGRTNGFTVPGCWDTSSNPVDLTVTHACTHEDYWDRAMIAYDWTGAPNYSTYLYQNDYDYGQRTDTWNLTAYGLDPTETIWIWFFQGGRDGCCNNNSYGMGMYVYEFTMD